MEERRKVYVEVRARHLIDGTCRPETITQALYSNQDTTRYYPRIVLIER